MKKILATAVVIVAALFVLFWQLDSIVKTGIVTEGPKVLAVKVGLEDVSLSPFSGGVTVKGLSVGQPAGFGDGAMLALDEFSMKVKLASLLDDHIIIEKMTVDAPLLDVRARDGETNFQTFQQRLNLDETKAKKGQEESAANDITLTIHELIVRAPRILAKTDGFIKLDQDIALADFTLTNLGTDEEGLAPKEIARHIMATLQPQIRKALIAAGASKGLKNIAEDAKGQLEKGFQGLLGKLKKKKDTKENQ